MVLVPPPADVEEEEETLALVTELYWVETGGLKRDH